MGLLASVDLILLIAIKELSPGFESALKRAQPSYQHILTKERDRVSKISYRFVVVIKVVNGWPCFDYNDHTLAQYQQTRFV